MKDERQGEVDQEGPTRTIDVQPLGAHLVSERVFEPGFRLGRYEIVRHLGEGGMSLVYEAQDSELGRRIAIKVMRTKYWNAAGQLRALREGQAMAKLSHPNVVAVHDVGSVGDQTFIAMELVDGVTLGEWLQRARTSREVLDALVQAGRGLAAAHAAGIVHRDVKPSNVLVDRRGRVRVTDFGIAADTREGTTDPSDAVDATDRSDGAAERESDAAHPRLTRTGAAIGTPAYMAPEQRIGRSSVLADQFSFCVMAYEALFGRQPEGVPVRSGTPGFAGAPRRAPRAVRRAISRGLSLDPALRYPSMDALLADLAVPPARTRVILAASAGALAVAAGTVIVLSRREATDPCAGVADGAAAAWNPTLASTARAAFVATGRPHATSTFARLDTMLGERTQTWAERRRDTCAATRVRGTQSEHLLDLRMRCLDRRLAELAALSHVFATAVDGDVVDNALVAARAQPPLSSCDDVASLEQLVPPPEDVQKRSLVEKIDARVDDLAARAVAGRHADALGLATSAAADAERASWAPTHARALYWLGKLQSYSGDSAASEKTLQRAMVRAGDARDDMLMADAGLELIYVLGYELARPDEALRVADLVSAMVRRAGADPRREAQLLDRIGIVYWAKHSLPEAQEHFERALAQYAKLPDTDDLTAAALTNLGNVFADRGQPEEARKRYEQELAILRRIHGADHPQLARALANIGTVLTDLERFDEAQQSFERALAIWHAAYGENHPMVAMVTNNLGDVLLKRGDAEAALGYCRRAYAIGKVTLPDQHPVRAYHAICVANALNRLARYAEAATSYEEAVSIRAAAAADVGELAEARIGLAKARYEVTSGADRARARALAVEAQGALAKAGDGEREKLVDVTTWLRDHP